MKKLVPLFLLLSITGFSQHFTGEKKAAKDAVVAFLKWYKTGNKGFDQYKLYMSAKAKTDGPPYKINWKTVEKHFAWIKAKAPLFAAAFIVNEKQFFEYCDLEYKKNPEDEIPSGFDYERVMGSQEDVAYVINDIWLKKGIVWKVTLRNTGEAEVSIAEKGAPDDEDAKEHFLMVKENGKWRVALPPGLFGVPPFTTATN
ncbi:MAG: hypothetical protein ABIX01_07225 [Chitinophagaceae bacterium]